jgi:vacuolar iron transporter family protein
MSDLVRGRLRDAVFGTQDGLISTLGALTGIAVGTQSGAAVIIAGVVIVAVESLSMAAGSYLSSKSQRQYLEHLISEEKEAIEKDPEGEKREVWTMYRARGYREDEIGIILKRLLSDKKLLLEDMAHKELGISLEKLEDPLGNALVMGMAYVLGGLIPVVPYLILDVHMAIVVSILGTFVALFAFGGLKGRVVGQVWWRSGFEMLAIAGLAALVGFVIGRAARYWVGG